MESPGQSYAQVSAKMQSSQCITVTDHTVASVYDGTEQPVAASQDVVVALKKSTQLPVRMQG